MKARETIALLVEEPAYVFSDTPAPADGGFKIDATIHYTNLGANAYKFSVQVYAQSLLPRVSLGRFNKKLPVPEKYAVLFNQSVENRWKDFTAITKQVLADPEVSAWVTKTAAEMKPEVEKYLESIGVGAVAVKRIPTIVVATTPSANYHRFSKFRHFMVSSDATQHDMAEMTARLGMDLKSNEKLIKVIGKRDSRSSMFVVANAAEERELRKLITELNTRVSRREIEKELGGKSELNVFANELKRRASE